MGNLRQPGLRLLGVARRAHRAPRLRAAAQDAPPMSARVDPLTAFSGMDGTAPGALRVDAASLQRVGLDLLLEWPDGTRFGLSAIRDTRDGIRGELTVTDAGGRRLSWGALPLSSL